MNGRILLLLIVLSFVAGVFVGTFIGPRLFIAGGPNLILNGDFESDAKFVNTGDEPIQDGSQCKSLCGGSEALENWRVFKQPVAEGQSCGSDKDAICWFKSPNTTNINAQHGSFAVDLTGFSGRPPRQFGQVQQSVENTQPGQIYELSFDVGSSQRFPPPNGARIGVFVRVNGVPNAGSFDATQTTEPSHWDLQSMQFKALDRLTTIMFFGNEEPLNNQTGGDYVGLDNVVLRKVCFMVDAILFGCSI